MPCNMRINCECETALSTYSSESSDYQSSCDVRVTCCEVETMNFSSEEPDRIVFLRTQRRAPPPFMNVPTNPECTTFSSSPTSQEDADQCADAAVQSCITETPTESACDQCKSIQNLNQTTFGINSQGFRNQGSQEHLASDACCDPSVPAVCCCSTEPNDPDDAGSEPPVNPPGGPPGGGGPNGPTKPPGGGGPQTYCNKPQTAKVTCDDGREFTYTTPAGKFCAISQGQADIRAMVYAEDQLKATVNCNVPIVTGPCENVCLETPVDFYLPTSMASDTDPFFEIVAGSPPPGVTMDGFGHVTGTPTATGKYYWDVKVSNLLEEQSYVRGCMDVLGITDDALPDGTEGVAYSYQMNADGGNAPYHFSASGLPANLVIAESTGIISGNASATGTFNPVFTVRDNSGRECSTSIPITIKDVVTVTVKARFAGNDVIWGKITFNGSTSATIATPGGSGYGAFYPDFPMDIVAGASYSVHFDLFHNPSYPAATLFGLNVQCSVPGGYQAIINGVAASFTDQPLAIPLPYTRDISVVINKL